MRVIIFDFFLIMIKTTIFYQIQNVVVVTTYNVKIIFVILISSRI